MWALFFPALIGALSVAMASFVGRVLIAMSVGFVTYTGISLAVSSLKTTAVNGVNALPADALGLVGYLWLDKAMTIIFSAIVASLTMKAIGGSIKKMVFK